jgi:exodeoxyribonuclease V alpha subunit
MIDVLDPYDARRVRTAPEPLRAFNDAGVLAAADVHVALRLIAIGGGAAEASVGVDGGAAEGSVRVDGGAAEAYVRADGGAAEGSVGVDGEAAEGSVRVDGGAAEGSVGLDGEAAEGSVRVDGGAAEGSVGVDGEAAEGSVRVDGGTADGSVRVDGGAAEACGGLGEAGAEASVALAVALAVRGPRLGHVYVDLATIREQATVDLDEPVDLGALPWPEIDAWTRALRAHGLVATGEDDDAHGRPLRLAGTRLYLDRYWREERQVAADLEAFAGAAASGVQVDVLADGLRRLFARDADERQRVAAATATLRRLTVVAGGPGTGKTTTVARILALLCEQAAAAGAPTPLVALAAPTGKAAARLQEAVHAEAATLRIASPIREQLLALDGSTLHRLLGWRAGSHSRFRHDRSNRLPYDIVVVDETSMVSLSLMARLVEAVRPDARLILVGDPGQLTSIEAGAVLGDIVGPAAAGPRMRPPARRALAAALGHAPTGQSSPEDAVTQDAARRSPRATAAGDAADGALEPGAPGDTVDGAPEPRAPGDTANATSEPHAAIGDAIVVLDRSHRFGPAIAAVAAAVSRGDADATLMALRAAPDRVIWIDVDVAEDPDALTPVRDGAVAAARAVIEPAAAGDAAAALDAMGAFRVLCAYRRGEHGAATWRARVESWLAEAIDGFAAQGEWYAGRPLLVTENDYGLRLYNGDTGVVVADGPARVGAAFERHDQLISPTRLEAVDTVYAMTIHKAQGSQFDTAAVLLPPATSPILTRELLYTAVTRARTRLIVAGTEEAVRAAVGRPVARASGLRERLWGDETDR